MNNWLFSISAAAIVTAIFKMLVPDDRMGKQLKLLISCFFIVTAINFFADVTEFQSLKEIFQIDASYNDYSVIYEKQTADEAANLLRKRIYTALEKENIHPEKIYIDINISQNKSISISKIRLVFKDKHSGEAERAVEITENLTQNEIKAEAEEW